MWGFFWRSVVTLIGVVLIIPAPWVGPWFYKWLCERISLPDGRPLTFSGKPGDIWYVFVAWGALMWIGQLKEGRFELVTIVLSWILGVLLLKWVCAHASTADERLKLSFEGGYLPYIGWNILLALSAITIIGWAWVMKYMLRWICQNVRGTAEFAFTGTGLEILWRTSRRRAAEHPDHPDPVDDALVHAVDVLSGGGADGGVEARSPHERSDMRVDCE